MARCVHSPAFADSVEFRIVTAWPGLSTSLVGTITVHLRAAPLYPRENALSRVPSCAITASLFVPAFAR